MAVNDAGAPLIGLAPKKVSGLPLQVRVSLEDNFNTAGAMKALDKLISGVNKYISRAQAEKRQTRVLLLTKAARFVKRILSVFGKPQRCPSARLSFAVSLCRDIWHVNCKLGGLKPLTVEAAAVLRGF
jgi:cysteinyl-tRNA synthetase